MHLWIKVICKTSLLLNPNCGVNLLNVLNNAHWGLFFHRSWGADAKILRIHEGVFMQKYCKFKMERRCKNTRIAAPSLIYSTSEYYAPIWCHSTHAHFIDSVLLFSMTPYALSEDACAPHYWTTCQFYQVSSELSSVDKEKLSYWHTSVWWILIIHSIS